MSRAALAVLALLAAGGAAPSGADFVAGASSPANDFAAAADFNTVAVAMSDPGTPLRGKPALQATASSDRGIERVRFQSSPTGAGAWTDACEDDASPYACDWDTDAVADGPHDLRAVATDRAGYQRSSATVTSVLVDNTAPTVSVGPPPAAVRGTFALAFDAADGGGSGVEHVRGELRPSGGGAWTQLCTDAQAPYECAGLDSTQFPDGLYDARAIAEDHAGSTTTSSAIAVRVDNAPPPAPTLADPGAILQGAVALSGAATDAGSGVAAWIVQYRPSGGTGAWTDACSDAASPYTCSWDTTGVADALYDVRAVARDRAGNETPSATISNRRVDNGGPTLAFADPGAYLRGVVALSATATDPAGVQSVVFERRLASGGGWTTICTDTGAPYACSFDTTGVADGSYDLRARAVDSVAHSSTATASARAIDNARPDPAAVDAGNGGATPGRLDPGDWLRLTWTEAIAPASVLAGWDGAPVAVSVRVQDANANDELNVWDAAGTTRSGLIDPTNLKLNANFVTGDAWFDATLTRSGAAFTITLGAQRSGTLATAAAGTIRWRPSSLATDLAGNATSTTNVSEPPNPQDLDF